MKHRHSDVDHDQTTKPASVSRQIFSSAEIEVISTAVERLYPGTKVKPIRRGSLSCECRVSTVGPVNFVSADWQHGAQLEGLALGDRYALVLAGDGSSDAEITTRNRRFSVIAGKTGVLFAPEQPGRSVMAPGAKGRSITIARSALEAHYALLMGHEPPTSLVFDPAVDLTDNGGAVLYGVVRLLREELARKEASPLVRPHLCDVLLTALVSLPHPMGEKLAAPTPSRVAPGVVRRAEEYIVAHAGEPITLAALVAAAGAPARSLQAAFRAARGVTPMGFLKVRRLELARQMLLAPLPETSVADVANAIGYRSAGRFAVEYRKHFRESPSETRARGRSLT